VLNDGGLFNSGPDFSTALRSARNDTGVWNGDKCSISTKDDPPNKFEGLNLMTPPDEVIMTPCGAGG